MECWKQLLRSKVCGAAGSIQRGAARLVYRSICTQSRFRLRSRRASVALAVAVAAGAKITPLKIAVASHSPLMAAASARFRTILAECVWKTPSAPILAGISGAAIRQRSSAIDALSNQIDHRLNWQACLVALIEHGCTALLELGPGSSLSRMAQECFPHISTRSCSDFTSIDGIADWVSRASREEDGRR